MLCREGGVLCREVEPLCRERGLLCREVEPLCRDAGLTPRSDGRKSAADRLA